MELQDRVAVITGGASGIGEGLAERFHAEGARHVVVVDRDEAGAKAVAERVSGTGVAVDVSDEGALTDLVAQTERDIGPIDLFVSNAGYVTVGGLDAGDGQLGSVVGDRDGPGRSRFVGDGAGRRRRGDGRRCRRCGGLGRGLGGARQQHQWLPGRRQLDF